MVLNEQPWRYILATKANQADFERLLSCLVEGNQAWARAAPVLALGCTSLRFALNNEPNAAAVHDLGLASANLTVEATARGLYVHQMIGILPDRARELYLIPEDVQPVTGLATGYAADPGHAAGEVPETRPCISSEEASGGICLWRRVGVGLQPGQRGHPVAEGKE